MRLNEKTAIATSSVLLVPYEAHQVVKYHSWMQDPAIQEATASEPLTLEEEYENQQSWRTAHDKLTFIVCEPLTSPGTSVTIAKAKSVDADENTRGDVNFFLYEDDDEDHDADDRSPVRLKGEIDVMIADNGHRRQGYGRGAVEALLTYIRQHMNQLMEEYAAGAERGRKGTMPQLKALMAKIKQDNVGSRALFEKLGFKQVGEVNYFGEILLVISWEEMDGLIAGWLGGSHEGSYREIEYQY